MIILFLFFSPYKNEFNKRKKIINYIKYFFEYLAYKLYR